MNASSEQGDPLIQAILHAPIPDGARLLVAVSGGPDSVALLDAIRRTVSAGLRDLTLRIVHINHCLRGDESDQDEAFVRALGKAMHVDVSVVRVDTRKEAAERRLSIEVAARELRYGAIVSALQDWPGDLALMGHTQNDQAETLLLRMLRGTGIVGLGAMRERRGRIVRPFLSVSHETVLDALQRRQMGYRLDSSNLDMRHTRNRLRRDVMPVLQLIQPRVVQVLARNARSVQQSADFILDEASRAGDLALKERGQDYRRASLAVLKSLHPGLRPHVVRVLMQELTGEPVALSESHLGQVLAAIDRGRGVIDALPGGLSVEVGQDHVDMRVSPAAAPWPAFDRSLLVPGEVLFPGGSLSAHLFDMSQEDSLVALLAVCGPHHALCDADRMGEELIVRARRAGDRIQPLGMYGTRKVQDVLVDRHIPRALRDRIPLVQDETGIVWLPGIMLDDRVAVRDTTKRITHLTFRPDTAS